MARIQLGTGHALTSKINGILVNGGVDAMGPDRDARVATATQYIEHLYQQQWTQLERQASG
ncbi:hypothetical protein SCUCBS95973_002997 [Sporothrix curviconia]|uniref:Uncharacterized protein n=1 Tax=Sporothrix curviconia TaxID=1260050 RepID=A0ABP0BBK0_9PEZI